jgi:hypothetical protein
MWKSKEWHLLNGHLWIELNGKDGMFSNYYGLGFSISTMGVNLELIFFDITFWWKND